MIPALMSAGPGGATGPDLRLVTITHVQMGQPAFGITPGQGTLWATLRTLTDDQMARLVADAEAIAAKVAQDYGLALTITYHDDFAAGLCDSGHFLKGFQRIANVTYTE